jgi:hypothetical protein
MNGKSPCVFMASYRTSSDGDLFSDSAYVDGKSIAAFALLGKQVIEQKNQAKQPEAKDDPSGCKRRDRFNGFRKIL